MKCGHVTFFGCVLFCAFLVLNANGRKLSRKIGAKSMVSLKAQLKALAQERMVLDNAAEHLTEARQDYYHGVESLLQQTEGATKGGDVERTDFESSVTNGGDERMNGEEHGEELDPDMEEEGDDGQMTDVEEGDHEVFGGDTEIQDEPPRVDTASSLAPSDSLRGNSALEDDRAKLDAFYHEKGFDDKEEHLDEIIGKYNQLYHNEAAGHLESDLTKKYGPEWQSVEGGAGNTPNAIGQEVRFVASKTSSKAMLMSKKLTNYYAKYNPERMKDVAKILKGYEGKMDRLSEKLKAKYGASLDDFKGEDNEVLLEETEDITKSMTPDEAREELLQTYAKYESDKLPYVDSLVDMYAGRESELVRSVKKKFRGFDTI